MSTTPEDSPSDAQTHGLLPPLTRPAAVSTVAGERRPNLRFLLAHPAHAIALGLGSGLVRWAPGTVGTLWAWASFLILDRWITTPATWAAVIVGTALLGWWASAVTARHLGVADSSHMVIDEVVAFWAVLWLLMPANLGWQCLAFVLFRLFDAVKVGPMAWADRRFKGFGWRGGFGVMLDDAAAAFCTLLVLAGLARVSA